MTTAGYESTVLPIKAAHADKSAHAPALGEGVAIRRRLVTYSYPSNGNVHNPTPYYAWDLILDGRNWGSFPLRRMLISAAPSVIAEARA